MIFYFSGTGNSKWVAEQVAKRTGDTAVNISSLTQTPDLTAETRIGFVFPIYAWGAAEPMLTFAGTLPSTEAFTFGICTCGADAGLAMKRFSKVYSLKSAYSIVMPDNYVVGSNLDSKAAIDQKLQNAARLLENISQEISQQKSVYQVHEGSAAYLKSTLATKGFNHFARTTKPFTANENCNGCGLCVRNCPAKTIVLENGKPVWGKECYQCLSCINRCPKEAIQYGKSTAKRGRYFIEKNL